MNSPDRHEDMLERLSAYIDGTLSADERAAVESACAADPELRQALAALRRVDEMVQAAAGPVPELDWAEFTRTNRTKRLAVGGRAAGGRWRSLMLPLSAAAAIALAVTAGILWNAWTRTTPTSPDQASVAIVTVERTTVTADANSLASASIVRPVQGTRSDAFAGPPRARRTLIVAVAGQAPDRADGTADEEAGYF
ncbi:MAG TPA: zf-HC2 domain-containing protein [Phycisphaerae bacterium]|nr:zf-HC2 domain-containing protein [Phycisphaerae bacterium]